MERGSRVRIIGNASEEGKEKVRVDIDNAFHHHIEYLPNDLREKFQQNELPKIEQEIALIACVNKATNELLEQCYALLLEEAFVAFYQNILKARGF